MPKTAKLHQKATGFYAYTEHGCAVLYAACEFSNLHIVLIALSGALLFGAIVVAVLKLVEAL